MGNPIYNSDSRAIRSRDLSYSKVVDDDEVYRKTFKQVDEGKIHDLMNPYGVIRESRDSENHPNAIPVIIALDVTGSMGHIPKMFLASGLPTLFSKLIQAGVEDIALCFIAIGDHETDRAPLQVGQFESGDEEIDLWLTRTWPEKGGGNNAGESYHLAWYFAAYQTVTDAWEKRGQKGFLFTIGDEPCLPFLPSRAIKEITGGEQPTIPTEDLLKIAQEKWNVFHFNLTQTFSGDRPRVTHYWESLLGQQAIMLNDYNKIPDKIAEILLSNIEIPTKPVEGIKEEDKDNSDKPFIR
jgi:hypothetical protein